MFYCMFCWRSLQSLRNCHFPFKTNETKPTTTKKKEKVAESLWSFLFVMIHLDLSKWRDLSCAWGNPPLGCTAGYWGEEYSGEAYACHFLCLCWDFSAAEACAFFCSYFLKIKYLKKKIPKRGWQTGGLFQCVFFSLMSYGHKLHYFLTVTIKNKVGWCFSLLISKE